jgi:rare lipoprotein A
MLGSILAAMTVAAISTPALAKSSAQHGVASWYGSEEHGGLVANYPERYNMYALTAASNTLPLGTCVSIYNKHNGKSIHNVRINDRGGFSRITSRVNGRVYRGRIIDVSYAVAKRLEFTSKGLEEVKVVATGKVSRKARSC